MLTCEVLQSLTLIQGLPKPLLDKLLSDNDINVQDSGGNSALHYAADQGIGGSVVTLIQAGCDLNLLNHDQDSSFMKAVRKCTVNTLRVMISLGAEVNIQNRYGCTPLMNAVLSTSLDKVSLLLEHGAMVNIQTQMNATALHMASGRGLTDIISCLSRASADLNLQDNEGLTPVMWAVGQGHMDIVEHLRLLGCDMNKTDLKGNTLLHEAVSVGLGQFEILQYLLKDKCINMNIMNNSGATALTEAARCANREAIEVLIENGCDVNLGTITTPLTESAYFGDLKNVNLLLKAGANPNVRNTKLQTPLYWAIICKHPSVVKVLIKANTDLNNIYDKNSAVYICAAKGCWKELEILWQAGCNMNKVFKDSNSPVPNKEAAPRRLPVKINKCPWLVEALANPRNLKVLCREVIRSCLPPNPQWRIDTLPIPNKVKDYLALNDL